jgi:hypothetical protein
MIYKALDRKRVTRTPMKTVDELRYAGKGKQFLPLWFPLIVLHFYSIRFLFVSLFLDFSCIWFYPDFRINLAI